MLRVANSTNNFDGGKETDFFINQGFGSATGSFSGTKGGWTVGGGIEAHLWGPWTGKIEYLHVDLGSTTNVLTFPVIVGVTSLTTNTEMRADIIRAGLNYKFGWVR